MTALIDFAKKRFLQKFTFSEELTKCSYCNRPFPHSGIRRHQTFCIKINGKRREKFESSSKRTIQSGNKIIRVRQSTKDEIIPKGKKTNWRNIRQIFISQIRQSRNAGKILKKAYEMLPKNKSSSKEPLISKSHKEIPKNGRLAQKQCLNSKSQKGTLKKRSHQSEHLNNNRSSQKERLDKSQKDTLTDNRSAQKDTLKDNRSAQKDTLKDNRQAQKDTLNGNRPAQKDTSKDNRSAHKDTLKDNRSAQKDTLKDNRPAHKDTLKDNRPAQKDTLNGNRLAHKDTLNGNRSSHKNTLKDNRSSQKDTLKDNRPAQKDTLKDNGSLEKLDGKDFEFVEEKSIRVGTMVKPQITTNHNKKLDRQTNMVLARKAKIVTTAKSEQISFKLIPKNQNDHTKTRPTTKDTEIINYSYQNNEDIKKNLKLKEQRRKNFRVPMGYVKRLVQRIEQSN